jgi:hypothetical protein
MKAGQVLTEQMIDLTLPGSDLKIHSGKLL